MSNEKQRDDALFDELSKSRKKRRRRILITVISIVAVVAVVLVGVLTYLRGQVRERFAAVEDEVLSYAAATGTLQSVISGNGVLEYVDLEERTVPAGVEITEVLVERNDTVSQGDILATVDMSTVMQALASVQEAIDDLDDEISDAESDSVSSSISSGVGGRVKHIYAEKGDDVAACMAENGALALISLDGFLAVDIETDALEANGEVTVVRADGSEIEGTVDSVVNGTATILVTDNGPKYEEEVTVVDAEGKQLGGGSLYIHKPLRVTGYAGTISTVSAKENQTVYNGTRLFTLTDTSFSTSYETLLRQRQEQEEILMELLTIYRDGAVVAPYDGLVSSVDYDEETVVEGVETSLVTMTPNESVQVSVSISESNILSLAVGQTASVTVSSVGDEAYTGVVTEVSQTATTSSSVTTYTAVVELSKADGMLPGMSAEVDVQIEGVENAILVPVDAVHQTSAIYYVYTSYDEETGQYGGMVVVETGLWGEDLVEITSGLNVGDVVYYTEKEELFSFANFMAMGGMSGASGNYGGRNGAASMPSGGSMPGGGSFSGGMPSMGGGR